jgi:outer membrane biosynthesis protein TonB
MNKKLLFLSASALLAGFFVFTAFGGKTLEQQKAEITQTVTAQLEELRIAKEQECTDKVNAEAQLRFDKVVADRAAAAAAKPGVKPKPKPKPKPGGSTSPVVDPLPQPTPTDPKKDKTAGNQQQNTEEKKAKTAGEAPVQNTDKKKSKTAGGGN